jgi:hypothetical protein
MSQPDMTDYSTIDDGVAGGWPSAETAGARRWHEHLELSGASGVFREGGRIPAWQNSAWDRHAPDSTPEIGMKSSINKNDDTKTH